MAADSIYFPNKESWTLVEFLTDGNWQVPKGITRVFMEGCGGGGAAGSITTNFLDAAQGGHGAAIGLRVVDVVPDDILSITIGQGGVGGSPKPAFTGNDGGDTIVTGSGVDVRFRGGVGGTDGGYNPANTIAPERPQGAGGTKGGVNGRDGENSIHARGGYGGLFTVDTSSGGGAAYGDGGDSGTTPPYSIDAEDNSGAGGGTGNNSGTGGGDGGSGRLYIYYLAPR